MSQRVTEAVNGAAIVMRGSAQSGADQIASIFAAQGDSSYMRQLEVGRRQHIAILDSVLRVDAAVVSRLPLSYDEELIVVDENSMGGAAVLAATTSMGFGSNGGSVSLTGQVSVEGTEADITVMYNSQNVNGSRPADIPYTEKEGTKQANFGLDPDCVRAHPHELRVCAFGSYAELAVPSTPIGQSCGTKVVGQTRAVARWDFHKIEVVLLAFGFHAVGAGVSVPSNPFTGPSYAELNALCVRPVVKAQLSGGADLIGENSYSATIPVGANTVSLIAAVLVTNVPVPMEDHYVIKLDGTTVLDQSGQQVVTLNVGLGNHLVEAWAERTGFDLAGYASATLSVTNSEGCTESGQGGAGGGGGGGPWTIRALPVSGTGGNATTGAGSNLLFPRQPGQLCGQETGTPGGGGGSVPPAEGLPSNCQWGRWFVIYTDGSWRWLTEWERVCDGDPMLRAGPTSTSESIANASLLMGQANLVRPRTGPIRVRLLGAGALESGKSVEVHRYRDLNFEGIIRIDTSRATPADMEAAFTTVRATAATANQHVAAIQGAPSSNAVANSGLGSRARELLSRLATAPVASSVLGEARIIDATIGGAESSIRPKGTKKSPNLVERTTPIR